MGHKILQRSWEKHARHALISLLGHGPGSGGIPQLFVVYMVMISISR